MQARTTVNQRTVASGSGSAVTIIGITGDISSTSKDAILGAYHELNGTAGKILLDFRGVDYINSSGIAIVIELLLEEARAGGQRIGIFGLSPHFQKVFTMVGINKYAPLHVDEASALRAI